MWGAEDKERQTDRQTDNEETVCIPVSYTHLDVYKRQPQEDTPS